MNKRKIQLGDDGEFLLPVDRSNAARRRREPRPLPVWVMGLLFVLVGLSFIVASIIITMARLTS